MLRTLDLEGQTAGHTGDRSLPYAGHECCPNLAVGGNILASCEVVASMAASVLCLTPARPPLDLRIDSSYSPLDDLRAHYDKCNSSP